MRRKQLYLDEDLDERLKVAAAAEGRSAAAIVREAVRRYLTEGESAAASDPFLEIAGAFSGGPRDAAAKHDDYLYRRPRRREKKPKSPGDTHLRGRRRLDRARQRSRQPARTSTHVLRGTGRTPGSLPDDQLRHRRGGATRLRYDTGVRAALAFRTAVDKAVAQRRLRVHWVDPRTEREGWKILERYADLPLSLTDAMSVAVARRSRANEVFGFDEDFRALGFDVRPADQ